MKIIGIENLTAEQVDEELRRGGRFVMYQYCISVLIMSFKRSSDIYFIPADQGSVKKGLGFVALSLVVGWWGFPWGPVWTIGTVFKNLSGGLDVTGDVLNSINRKPVVSAPNAI